MSCRSILLQVSLTKTKPCALAGDDSVKMLKPTKGYDAHISRAKAASFDDIEMAWEKSQVCCDVFLKSDKV